MDKSTARSKAKLVAYLQAAFVGLSLILVIFLGLIMCERTFPNFPTGLSETKFVKMAKHYLIDLWELFRHKHKENFLLECTMKLHLTAAKSPNYVDWIVYIIFVALVGVQGWITTKLMQATEEGTSPDKALRNVEIWRNVTAGGLVIEAFFCIACMYGIITTTGLLFQTFGILLIVTMINFMKNLIFYDVVSMFVLELEKQPSVYVV